MKSWIRWARLLAAGLILAGALLTPGLGAQPANGAPGDDEAVIVEPVSGLITDEGGGSATFVIYLSKRPGASVQIRLSSSDSGEGAPSPDNLVINPAEWRTRHVITVIGVDDGIVDGDVAYQIRTSDTSSWDNDFDDLEVDDVWVTNLDNDSLALDANDDNDITAEDTPVSTPVLDNDQGVNSGPLSLTVTAGPTHGTAQVGSNQQIIYTPNPNYHGTDSYTYQVSNPSGSSDSAQVQITVSSVNDAPVAVNDTGTLAEDLNLTIDVLANDTDVDGDPLSIVGVTQPSHGVTSVVDGKILYVPVSNFSGFDSFAYRIDDGHGARDTAVVTLNVNGDNDPPDAKDDIFWTSTGSSASFAVLNNDTDPDGDRLLLESFDSASVQGGTVTRRDRGTPEDLSDDLLLYTPPDGFSGSDSFTYVASDGTLTDTAVVTVNVTSSPYAPLANDDTYSLDAETTLEVGVEDGVLSNDVDPYDRNLIAYIVSDPEHGILDFQPDGSFTYTPNSGFSGDDGFDYRAQAGWFWSSQGRVTLTVRSVNQAPVAHNDHFTVGASGILTVTHPGVLENDVDPDGQSLTAMLDSGPTHGSLSLNPDGSFTYEPQPGFMGADQFTYSATDGAANSALAVVEITVPDLIPPAVEWISPTAASQRFDVGAELVRLEVSATDNTAIDRVHFFRWDARLEQYLDIAMLTAPPYRVDLNAELLNPEWNQIFVRAYDSAGNVSERKFIWLFQTQQTANIVYLVTVHR